MIKNETLTENYFFILLCLLDEPCHGYGIMQKTKEITEGRVIIGSGTMYGATSNMMKKKWIQEEKKKDPEDERKRLYCLTEKGEEILMREYQRLLLDIKSAERIIKRH